MRPLPQMIVSIPRNHGSASSSQREFCNTIGVRADNGEVLGRGDLSASLIGRSGSSAFGLSTAAVSMSLTGSCFSSESAPGALPSWDSRTRWNNLMGGLAVSVTAGPSGQTNSPHPSSRKGHLSTAGWSSNVLLSRYCAVLMPLLLLPGSSGTRCHQPICGA